MVFVMLSGNKNVYTCYWYNKDFVVTDALFITYIYLSCWFRLAMLKIFWWDSPFCQHVPNYFNISHDCLNHITHTGQLMIMPWHPKVDHSTLPRGVSVNMGQWFGLEGQDKTQPLCTKSVGQCCLSMTKK